jgi:copper resistance protein D
MPAEPLISWPQPILELLGFLGWYLTLGALGFWFVVQRKVFVMTGIAPTEEHVIRRRIGGRAVVLGLLGAWLGAVMLGLKLPEQAERAHVEVGQLIVSGGAPTVALGLALLAIVGFTLALGRRGPGFVLAAIGVVGRLLLPALFGQWKRLANPVHILGGGLWIGTLFVLVFAGLMGILGSGLSPDRRGRVASAMVHAFSPLALVAFGVLGISGLVTAWTHLHTLLALWTTPYGFTLLVKLCIVAGVLALGAWNWRRLRPALGSEDAAHTLRRSATHELCVAALVLAVTAILVSLPSPRPPKAASASTEAGPAK